MRETVVFNFVLCFVVDWRRRCMWPQQWKCARCVAQVLWLLLAPEYERVYCKRGSFCDCDIPAAWWFTLIVPHKALSCDVSKQTSPIY